MPSSRKSSTHQSSASGAASSASGAASSSQMPSSSQVPSSSQAASSSHAPSSSQMPSSSQAASSQAASGAAASASEQQEPSQIPTASQAAGGVPEEAPDQIPGSQGADGGSQFPFQQNRGQVNVRRPKAIVFDILGTASKSGFLEKILFPFLRTNMETYINQHWNRKDFKKLHRAISDQSHEFQRQDPNTPVVTSHGSADSKATLLAFINYITDNGIASSAVTKLRFMIWFTGYQQSKLITPIYKDVPNRMRTWFAEGVKFYVFSNTWVEAQKALLKNTNHGDLTNLISGHYDNDFGQLNEVDSWRRLCMDIRENPNDVLFLTKSPVEARAAMESGVQVVLVLTHRHNVKAVTPEERQMFPYVRTLDDLNWLEGSMMPASSDVNISQRSTAKQRSVLASAPVGNLTSGQNMVPTALSVQSGAGSKSQLQSRPLVGSQQTGLVTSAGSGAASSGGTHSASAMAGLASSKTHSKSKQSKVASSAHSSTSQRRSSNASSTKTSTGGVSKQSNKGGSRNSAADAGASSAGGSNAGASSAAGSGSTSAAPGSSSQSAAGKSKKSRAK